MSLPHVLLTSLLERPSTGFELARRFDRSMGFFWNATHQQIYRELNNRHCCKVSDEAAFCLIQRPYISKTLLT
ncbi:hypothetical protein ABTB74_18915, partial [Acinetobacter baumannii]